MFNNNFPLNFFRAKKREGEHIDIPIPHRKGRQKTPLHLKNKGDLGFKSNKLWELIKKDQEKQGISFFKV